jgi:SAM-dependent methyltransferase
MGACGSQCQGSGIVVDKIGERSQGKIELGFFDRVQNESVAMMPAPSTLGVGMMASPRSTRPRHIGPDCATTTGRTTPPAPALERSRWVSGVVGTLGIASVLEVGTNSGRNLQVIRGAHPGVKLAGIDVNERAVSYAQQGARHRFSNRRCEPLGRAGGRLGCDPHHVGA